MKIGHFVNPLGYDMGEYQVVRYLWVFRKMLWEFRLHETNPLSFCVDRTLKLPSGIILRAFSHLQPDRHLITDLGTTPQSLQLFFPNAIYARSYIYHDSGYYLHGLFIQYPGKDDYEFIDLPREDIDFLLRGMIEVQGGSMVGRNIIWSAVHYLGWMPWKNKKDRRDEKVSTKAVA